MASQVLDVNTLQCPDLPIFIVEEILQNLPAKMVMGVCPLVCQEWKSIVDGTAFWRKRCRREGYEPLNNRMPNDWKIFYFLCSNHRNLLKNPDAKYQFQDWKIIDNGGDQWIVDILFKAHPDTTVDKCFVTSYGCCTKQQLINLEKEGYSPKFMDNIQPTIEISDWFAPRWDCGSEYWICVELLNHRRKPVHVFKPDHVIFPQWNDQEWNQMTHTFKDYGPGIRFIRFTHGGKDTQFWAGHYGIRVTHSSVEITPYTK